MKTNRWNIKKRTEKDLIDQILVNRSVPLSEKDDFLNPSYEKGLHDPLLLLNSREAILKIEKAKKENKKIGIFADYDADGVTSASLLHLAFDKIGIVHEVYIPSREQGYGINKEGIDYLKRNGAKMLVAVDMGITSKDEVEYANAGGMDVIVIDHHLIQSGKFPNAMVINPKQPGDKYPFKDISAAGVVYKFIQGLTRSFNEITKADLKWWLDLVAISTVADLVPLVNENRIFAYFGLKVIPKTRLPGLEALISKASLDKSNISAGSIAFQIAPRLNAPGRIDHANLSYKLLTSNDQVEINDLVDQIQSINTERQSMVEEAIAEASSIIDSRGLDKNKLILVSHLNWPVGVAGLISGKITEKYHRPSIVLCKGKSISKGSARSISSFHVMNALVDSGDFLQSFGGHSQAAGLSVKTDKIDEFYQHILKYADDNLKKKDLQKEILIDAKIEPREFSLEMAKTFEKLEPFGYGNSRPQLLIPSQKVINIKKCGKNMEHLKITTPLFEAMHFGGSGNSPIKGSVIDIVGSIGVNRWNNVESPEVRVVDWREC